MWLPQKNLYNASTLNGNDGHCAIGYGFYSRKLWLQTFPNVCADWVCSVVKCLKRLELFAVHDWDFVENENIA